MDRQHFMLEPAWKGDKTVDFRSDFGHRSGGAVERIGKAVKPEFAAAKTARLLAEIIHARQHTDALQAFARVDVRLEMAAVGIASELEFAWFDR